MPKSQKWTNYPLVYNIYDSQENPKVIDKITLPFSLNDPQYAEDKYIARMMTIFRK